MGTHQQIFTSALREPPVTKLTVRGILPPVSPHFSERLLIGADHLAGLHDDDMGVGQEMSVSASRRRNAG